MSDSAPAPKPNFIKSQWSKLGIQPFMIILALKGALPATIALAAYEADAFAAIYTTQGYLVAIIAHLSLALQPRAKFVQSLLVSILFTCLGAAISLLQLQCVVASRAAPTTTQRTGSSGSAEAPTYDSNANTVSAVFLFLWVFIANFVMASRPQLKLPTIQFTIFTVVTSVYGPQFPTMAAAESFIRRLLLCFVTGYGIAAGVSLLVFPVTSRSSVVKQLGGLTKLYQAGITQHDTFITSINTSQKMLDGAVSEEEKKAAETLRATIIATGELLGKVKLEIGFARKEIAYGNLGPDHFSQLFEMYREILGPIMGMSTFLEIIQSLREHKTKDTQSPEACQTLEAMRKLAADEWDEVIAISQDAYAQYKSAMLMGLQHASFRLGFDKLPKVKKDRDVESDASETSTKPGDAKFTKFLETELEKWQSQRNGVIQDWADHRKLTLPNRFWESQEKPPMERQETAAVRRKLNQHQLYLILYMNYLTHSLGQRILKLAQYADSLHEDGTLTHKRVIWPGQRRIRKLFMDAFTKSNVDETLNSEVNGGTNIYLGDGLKKKKDPEHLEPRNAYERATNRLRKIPDFFESEAASFAFRAAVAGMSIGIIAYLRATRSFFLQQRGMWAMIMTAISMDVHAGQGLFGFAARIFGTAFAMVMSMVIWYMCDHNHAVILVIFAIYMTGWLIFLIRMPQYAVVAMISSITVLLIIGYELQVDVIGLQAATSNGQEFYPVYLLGPYRLVTAVIGLAVAFFWTYFPYPVTTHGALRKDLGSTLYILANFYSCVHTTLEARLQLGPEINDLPKSHPIVKLDAARIKVFSKVILMLTRLREHHRFTRFEPPIGGRFPRETYNDLIVSIRNVFTYLSLMIYSSSAFIQGPEGKTPEEIEQEAQWLKDFRAFASETSITSHEFTTTLCLLAASIRNSQPLPPYLKSPAAFAVGDRLEQTDPSILGIQHFAHPCYAAFAVGEVARAFVTTEMAKITRLIRELVGEVDFSFHIVSTNSDGRSENATLWDKEEFAKETNGFGKTKGD